MDYPKQYRYTKEHEWVDLDGSTAKIGITDFAQQQLGDIVFAELPAVGTVLHSGQAFATVESVKAVSEVFAPLEGTVAEVNAEVAQHPERLNSHPHDTWLITATVSHPSAVNQLMDAAAYQQFLAASSDSSAH
ncbi:MAG TPA: glycine cleavage system protein GcvH [Terriglobales bacterium]|jgi:glycine cleavage system H protein